MVSIRAVIPPTVSFLFPRSAGAANGRSRTRVSTNLTAGESLATLAGMIGPKEYLHTDRVRNGGIYWRLQMQAGGFGP